MRPDWQAEAACRDMSRDLFFGPDDETKQAKERRERKAAKVCMGCPVRVDCLEYAIDSLTEHGVWGGLTARQRTQLAYERGA